MTAEELGFTEAVTFEEGGEWWPFVPRAMSSAKAVHSIRFQNGQIWDVKNGWRPNRKSQLLAKLQVMFSQSCGASDEGALKLAKKALAIMSETQ